MRSQEAMFQMRGSQGRERLWPCCLESSQCCCRDCVQKLPGYWSCAECSERKPHAEFTAWRESRDYSQDGTQCCNTCISLALVCQIARRANERLTPLRRRERSRRQQAIIDEVRQEILERTRQKTTIAFTQDMQSCKGRLPDCTTGSVRPEAATASAASHEEPRPPEPDVTAKNGKQIRRYQCPFCQQHVKSTVETGQINHSFACGIFSVSLAAVSPAAFTNTHAQRAQQSFTQKRQLAKSKPGTETPPDAHAAGKAGT